MKDPFYLSLKYAHNNSEFMYIHVCGSSYMFENVMHTFHAHFSLHNNINDANIVKFGSRSVHCKSLIVRDFLFHAKWQVIILQTTISHAGYNIVESRLDMAYYRINK